jgi:hypothetical protein
MAEYFRYMNSHNHVYYSVITDIHFLLTKKPQKYHRHLPFFLFFVEIVLNLFHLTDFKHFSLGLLGFFLLVVPNLDFASSFSSFSCTCGAQTLSLEKRSLQGQTLQQQFHIWRSTVSEVSLSAMTVSSFSRPRLLECLHFVRCTRMGQKLLGLMYKLLSVKAHERTQVTAAFFAPNCYKFFEKMK